VAVSEADAEAIALKVDAEAEEGAEADTREERDDAAADETEVLWVAECEEAVAGAAAVVNGAEAVEVVELVLELEEALALVLAGESTHSPTIEPLRAYSIWLGTTSTCIMRSFRPVHGTRYGFL
jgi:hypothetical protein